MPRHTAANLLKNTPVAVAHTPLQMSLDVSLNVCGVKSKLSSADFVNFINDYDVICFTETKCDDVDMINIDIVFKDRNKLSRFKSGGILMVIKKNVDFKWKPIMSDFDSLLSVKVDKRSIGLDKELVLSCVYIPPSHSRYGNEEHFDELDNF